MTLHPGRIYYGQTVRLTMRFHDQADDDADPSTSVIVKTRSPRGTTTTYTFGTDSEVSKTATGNYIFQFQPSESGRWHVRWVGTDATYGTAIDESHFDVMFSEVKEQPAADYQ